MRTIDSAIFLAQSLQRELRIFWVRDEGLNCRFDMLWQPIPYPWVSMIECNRRPLKFLRTHIRVRHLPITWLPGPLYFSTIQNDQLSRFDFSQIPRRRTIRIESYSRFRKSDNAYSYLEPVPEITEEIKRRTVSFTPHTIGVHIRRTDNVRSIRHSPDDLFIEAMRAELEKEPDTNFYLATDDPSVRDKFSKLFEGILITHDDELRRNSAEGIRAALAEMYCLSATSKILGSYWSSFSTEAALLSGIPIERPYRD